MASTVDYVVVGAGLTGATVARALSDAGREVVVVESRNVVGGNAWDYIHESGARIHAHGPHYFRSSSQRIWSFVNRFASFYPYRAHVLAKVGRTCEQWPVSCECIGRLCGKEWKPAFRGTPTNFEEAVLAKVPERIYQLFIREYTEKQWDAKPSDLSVELAKRIDVRGDGEMGLTPRARFQGLPRQGYSSLVQQMLGGIDVLLGLRYEPRQPAVRARRCLVYTGPIDRYFGCALGRLAYRGQSREHRYFPKADYCQPCAQVNNPLHSGGRHIRSIEWKHLLPASEQGNVVGSVITRETPITANSEEAFEYPVPDARNRRLYERYRQRASSVDGIVICGRLGEYRYLDMDQAIGRALVIAERLIKTR